MSDQVEKAELQNEVAGIASDPSRWWPGARITPDDKVLATRGSAQGVRFYDDLLRDDQVATGLTTRIAALMGREWSILPGSDDTGAQAAADLVTRALNACRFNQAIPKFQRALLSGVGIVEVMWTVAGAELLPKEMRSRNPRRFVFRAGDAGAVELRLLTKESPADGVPLPPSKILVHRHGENYENPWGLGLGHRLWWPVFFKRQGIAFWLSAIEKFAQPTAVGRYPAGTPSTEQDKLLAALGAISTEAGVIIPEGMVIELLEAKRAGTFDTYERLCAYMDAAIIKIILGQTLTTQVGDSGSRALGDVHNAVRLELTKADADDLAETLNASLVRWIVDLNVPGYAAKGVPYPKLWWDVSQPEDLNTRAERDTKLRGLGYEPTPQYFEDTYGPGWERKAGGAPPADPGGATFADLFAQYGRPGRRSARFAEASDPQTTSDVLAGQLEEVAGDALDAVVDAIRGLVNQAQDLGEIRDGLLKLYPTLPTARLAELMGQALTVAALSGRSDLTDDIPA